MKGIISILLIFLMLINTACYSSLPIKIEDIESGQELIITTNDEQRLDMEAIIVKEDSLTGKVTTDFGSRQRGYIEINEETIPINNIKSVEKTELNKERTGLLILTILIGGIIVLSQISYDIDLSKAY